MIYVVLGVVIVYKGRVVMKELVPQTGDVCWDESETKPQYRRAQMGEGSDRESTQVQNKVERTLLEQKPSEASRTRKSTQILKRNRWRPFTDT